MKRERGEKVVGLGEVEESKAAEYDDCDEVRHWEAVHISRRDCECALAWLEKRWQAVCDTACDEGAGASRRGGGREGGGLLTFDLYHHCAHRKRVCAGCDSIIDALVLHHEP